MGRSLWIWAAFITVLVGAATAYTAVGDDTEAAPTLAKAAAQKFAGELHTLILEVQMQYVREVSEIDLMVAAMSALHENAGKTAPRDLREQLIGLKKDHETYHSKCVALLAQLRADLGDRPQWREQKDLMVSAAGFSRVLDPHCGFTQAREFNLDREGEYSAGIQFHNVPQPAANDSVEAQPAQLRIAELGKVPKSLLVKHVVPGGPAQQAGIRPGDTVIRIDDRTCEELTWAQIYTTFFPAYAELPSPSLPRNHRIEIQRGGEGKTRVVGMRPVLSFIPETVFGVSRDPNGNWNYVISPVERFCYARIGPLNVVQVDPNSVWTTGSELQQLLSRMKKDGFAGLILDLRWCPGGYLTAAQAVARSFLDHDKPIGQIRYRAAAAVNDSELRVDRFPDVPLVVLVNGETSGGGELIAAALQDYGRGVIAGERTRGKATIQRMLDSRVLPMKYRISIGEFLSPNSKKLQRFADSTLADEWGVRPDTGRWLPLSPEASSQLKEWWTWQVLRPAGNREALPTDDPEIDVQLSAALQMLRQAQAKSRS